MNGLRHCARILARLLCHAQILRIGVFFPYHSLFASVVAVIVGLLMVVNCPADTHYVVTNGTPGVTPVDPYTNWTTAGTNIIDVVNAAMTSAPTRMVWVSNGTYYLTNQVQITNALTLQSVNGRNVTIVDGNNYAGKPVTNRCFCLSASGAMLDGFTIANGCAIGNGGGVSNSAGTTIKNCRITTCIATNVGVVVTYGGGCYVEGSISNCEIIGNINFNKYGGGIYFNGNWGGAVANCVVASNLVYVAVGSGSETHGAGICVAGAGNINNCVIFGNVGSGNCYGGGVELNAGSTVRNSLIYKNTALYGGGVGVYYGSYGTIQNCTIISNSCLSGDGGGIYSATPFAKTTTIENVICYLNTGTSSNIYFRTDTVYTGSCRVVSSCIAPTNAFPTSGIQNFYYANNIESNPQFVNKDNSNFRLSANSPCVNAGTNQSWMTNAYDLDSRTRIRYGVVDMGAYEVICEGTIYRFGI